MELETEQRRLTNKIEAILLARNSVLQELAELR
jgi:hypothetical protein